MKIKKTMYEHGISEDLIEKFNFGSEPGINPEEIIQLIQQMDELLTPQQVIAIMQEQGCTKT